MSLRSTAKRIGKASGEKTSSRKSATLGAAHAKMHFLTLVDEVHSESSSFTITKRGKPMMRFVPLAVPKRPKSIFGCMKGTAKATGDIVGPETDAWEATQ